MISKTLYDEISSQWGGEVFQTWKRVRKSIPLFEKKILPQLAGKRVLEIGCNAGIYAWHIAPIAKSYVGIDISENFIQQAQITARYIKGAPVKFIHSAVGDFAESGVEFDTLFASYILYHLSDAEIEILEKKIAPRCAMLAVQIRTRKKRSLNSHDFMKAKNVEALYHRTGFNCHIHWANWRHTAFAAVGTKGFPSGFGAGGGHRASC